jgi:hypothetical protein
MGRRRVPDARAGAKASLDPRVDVHLLFATSRADGGRPGTPARRGAGAPGAGRTSPTPRSTSDSAFVAITQPEVFARVLTVGCRFARSCTSSGRPRRRCWCGRPAAASCPRSRTAPSITEQPSRPSQPRYRSRTNPVTPGPSHRATGIAPVAGSRAAATVCKNARLPMQSRFGRSPTKALLATFEALVPAIGMSPKESQAARGPQGRSDRPVNTDRTLHFGAVAIPARDGSAPRTIAQDSRALADPVDVSNASGLPRRGQAWHCCLRAPWRRLAAPGQSAAGHGSGQDGQP